MFKRINVTVLSTKRPYFKFDACNSSQKICHGGNKGLKTQEIFEKIQLGERLATN